QPAARLRDRRLAGRPVPSGGLPGRPVRRSDQEAVRRARGAGRRRRRCCQRRGVAGASLGRERRPVHQCRAHHGVGPEETARRTVGHRHRPRRRLPHRDRRRREMRESGRDREPGLSVRLKLTLSYAGFLMVAGALLLATVWVFLLRYVPEVIHVPPETVPGGAGGMFIPNQGDLERAFVPRAIQAMVFLLVFGLVGGWILAGRMLAPLDRITKATRLVAGGSLSHRIEMEGRSDEFRELADAFDVMLARIESDVAEQKRFAANASHELRTPLAITKTLLDAARHDPDH